MNPKNLSQAEQDLDDIPANRSQALHFNGVVAKALSLSLIHI